MSSLQTSPLRSLSLPEAHGSGRDGDPAILLWGLFVGRNLPSSGFPCDNAGLMQQLPKETCSALPSALLQEHVLLFLLNPKFKATRCFCFKDQGGGRESVEELP